MQGATKQETERTGELSTSDTAEQAWAQKRQWRSPHTTYHVSTAPAAQFPKVKTPPPPPPARLPPHLEFSISTMLASRSAVPDPGTPASQQPPPPSLQRP